jgi:hypothetical protein
LTSENTIDRDEFPKTQDAAMMQSKKPECVNSEACHESGGFESNKKLFSETRIDGSDRKRNGKVNVPLIS